MGPKKQNKPNAFLYFMQEQKPIVEKRLGRKLTMADMPEHCGATWKAMSQTDRSAYKRNEMGVKGKMDSRGRLLSEIEEQQKLYNDAKINMIKDISDTIVMMEKGNAIPTFEFNIIGATFYVKVDEGKYVPAEISVIKFSLKTGIIDDFHRIIAADIPAGFKYEAIQHSEQTHNIPLNFPDGETSLEVLERDLFKFIMRDSDKLPPLYTLDSLRDQTQEIMDACFGVDLLKIYSLDLLLQHLYSCSVFKKSIPKSIATDMLTNCKLDYIPSLGCPWHQATVPDAAVYCPMSLCQRWLFLMCDELRIDQFYGIKLLPGKHKPIKEDEEEDEEEGKEEIISPAYPSRTPWGVAPPSPPPTLYSSDAFPALGGGGRGRGVLQHSERLEDRLSDLRIGMTGIGRGKIPKFPK